MMRVQGAWATVSLLVGALGIASPASAIALHEAHASHRLPFSPCASPPPSSPVGVQRVELSPVAPRVLRDVAARPHGSRLRRAAHPAAMHAALRPRR